MSVEQFRAKRFGGKKVEFFGEYAYRTRIKDPDSYYALVPLNVHACERCGSTSIGGICQNYGCENPRSHS